MPTSAVNDAKHRFVSELLRLAKAHTLPISVNKNSDDIALCAAFKAVARKAHPDKGGSDVDMRDLLSAKQAWDKTRGSTVNTFLKRKNKLLMQGYAYFCVNEHCSGYMYQSAPGKGKRKLPSTEQYVYT